MQYQYHSALLNNGLGLVSIVESDRTLLVWSRKLGDVTMETKACSLLYGKGTKGIAGLKYKGYLI
jgi:hypothetical protein